MSTSVQPLALASSSAFDAPWLLWVTRYDDLGLVLCLICLRMLLSSGRLSASMGGRAGRADRVELLGQAHIAAAPCTRSQSSPGGTHPVQQLTSRPTASVALCCKQLGFDRVDLAVQHRVPCSHLEGFDRVIRCCRANMRQPIKHGKISGLCVAVADRMAKSAEGEGLGLQIRLPSATMIGCDPSHRPRCDPDEPGDRRGSQGARAASGPQ